MQENIKQDKPPPESAEVKLNADFLNKAFDNLAIENISISTNFLIKKPDGWETLKSMIKSFPQRLYIKHVKSKGKFLYGSICLEEREIMYFTCTLGMTGFWTNQDLKHNHIKFELEDGQTISYNDARKFGSINFFLFLNSIQTKLDTLGVNSLEPSNQIWKNEIYSPKITQRLQKIKDNTQVCEVLLDQSIFCGVGNYLKTEILYACGIHPASKWNKLSEFQIWNLFVQARIITKKAYAANGASFKSFKDASGQRTGTFSDEFQVYGRTQTPQESSLCMVSKDIFQDKRTTYFSPIEQKLFI